jgi:hypothetical protein
MESETGSDDKRFRSLVLLPNVLYHCNTSGGEPQKRRATDSVRDHTKPVFATQTVVVFYYSAPAPLPPILATMSSLRSGSRSWNLIVIPGALLLGLLLPHESFAQG